jgi:phosphoribosyl-AMP cyclohydrolase / phosphoribosyl-ATP pyrophosphohydrolase
MTPEEIEGLHWAKGNGLLPAIIQDAGTGMVLMTGYVNKDALASMQHRQEVVLWSRTRQSLWLKGETSGNRIDVERIVADCDLDAILVLGRPRGPTCHTGAVSCFPEAAPDVTSLAFLATLEQIVAMRSRKPSTGSYTSELFASGIRRIAQKVGEEGLEVALAAGAPKDELVSESADLLFHLLVLLQARSISLKEVAGALESRDRTRRSWTSSPHASEALQSMPAVNSEDGD